MRPTRSGLCASRAACVPLRPWLELSRPPDRPASQARTPSPAIHHQLKNGNRTRPRDAAALGKDIPGPLVARWSRGRLAGHGRLLDVSKDERPHVAQDADAGATAIAAGQTRLPIPMTLLPIVRQTFGRSCTGLSAQRVPSRAQGVLNCDVFFSRSSNARERMGRPTLEK